MAKTLIDFPVSYPYGATNSPYSPARPHRGNDHAAPGGTPIIIEGTLIGLVGTTGLSTGNHTHIQEWQGTFSNTRKPQNSFKGGIVTATGFASDFGNYVTIENDDGWSDTYAHLSRIDVKTGDKLGGQVETFKDSNDVRVNGFNVFGIDIAGSDPALLAWVGKSKLEFFKGLGAQVVNNTRAQNERYAELQKLIDGNESAKKLQAIKDALK